MADGRVWLAGAGCLGPGGVTNEVKELLALADVLVVDALVNRRIYAGFDGEVHYAGKRKGSHALEQEEINSLLLSLAKSGKNVLRLKGGDPFVFGRGHEEKEFLEKNGIAVSVHPGLSSSIAILEQAGIPVTDRNHASSFLVMTATNPDWEVARAHKGTLVLLMGKTKVEEIKQNLDGSLPARLLETDETGHVHVSGSTVASLPVSQTPWPGIVVVGSVCELAKEKPVVALSCSDHLKRRLEARIGGLVDFKSVLELEHIPLEITWDFLDRPGWLVFCSHYASRRFLALLKETGTDIRALARFKIACVGPETAAPFEERGILVDHVPQEHTTAALARFLETLPEPVTVFREESAPDNLPGTRINLYRNTYKKTASPDCDVAVFASAGAVTAWKQLVGEVPPSSIAISAVTGKHLENCVVAPSISADGLSAAILSQIKVMDGSID